MKIVSCFSRLSEIEPLAAAGADELYCAVADLPSFGYGVLKGGGLKAAARKAHALGKKLSLAVNSMRITYAAGQMKTFAARLERAAADGVDSFIVASPSVFELFSRLKRPLPGPVHLSSVQPCLNSLTARYFIRLGISRLILPSQVAPLECAEIFKECRAARVETEVFDYRFFGCVYVNGRCNLHDPVFHTFREGAGQPALCRCAAGKGPSVKPVGIAPGSGPEALRLTRRLYSRMTCSGPPRLNNAAAFFDFFTMGTNYLKYGTRADTPEVKVRKVKELRAMLDLAEGLSRDLPRSGARAAFIDRMTRWRGLEGGKP